MCVLAITLWHHQLLAIPDISCGISPIIIIKLILIILINLILKYMHGAYPTSNRAYCTSQRSSIVSFPGWHRAHVQMTDVLLIIKVQIKEVV